MISRRQLTALAATLLALAAGPARAELVVFDWSGYEDPLFHPQYSSKHGGSPTFANFGDEEEAFQKLRGGFTADISHPCSQSVPRWHAAGLLKPIDPAKVQAWGDLNPELRDLPGFVIDGKHYLLPFDWGNTALSYNTEQVPAEDVASLQVFADPKYQGRISLPDNVDDAYALAYLAVGVTDWTKVTDEQFKAASDFLRKVHPNVVAYWVDGAGLKQMMTSGEVLIAWAWNESAYTMAREGVPISFKRDTKEGLSSWVCGYVHLANGKAGDDLVYDYLNAVMQPDVAKHLVDAWSYGHANQKAMAELPKDLVASKGYDVDLETFKARTLFQSPLDQALREKMIAEFEKIKAGF